VSLESLTKDNHWALLVFFPAAWTFVCPTELLGFDEAHAEFARRRVNVVFASVDTKHSHLAWLRQRREEGGLGDAFHFPLLGDQTKNISGLFDVLIEQDGTDDEGLALRASFLIDPSGVLRHATYSDLQVGRSVDETLRLVDAFQFADANPGIGCPANWKRGQPTIKTDPKGSREYFRAANSKTRSEL
jgi:alkyl hydroperoxide reductase subunit AhpC